MKRIQSGIMAGLALALAACGSDSGTGQSGGPAVSGIQVSPSSTVVPVGKTTELVGIALDTNEMVMEGVTGFQFVSQHPDTAVVGTTSGVVTGLKVGTATIRVTLNRNGTHTQDAFITVTDPATQPMVTAGSSSNTFSPPSLTVTAGATVVFSFGTRAHSAAFDDVAGAPEDIPVKTNTTVARLFPLAGTFPYHCTIHSGMTGEIVVQP